MIVLDLKSNMAKLAKDIDLEQKAIRTAAQRALNTAARGRRTDASRALRDRYPSLKARDANDAFDLRLASRENLQAVITVRGRPMGLMRFVVGAASRRKIGVNVKVKGNTQTVAHAFVAKGRGFDGGRAEVLFIRQKYAPRSKAGASGLVALRTIDLPNAVNIKELAEILEKQTGERFDKEFLRQMQLALNRQ